MCQMGSFKIDARAEFNLRLDLCSVLVFFLDGFLQSLADVTLNRTHRTQRMRD